MDTLWNRLLELAESQPERRAGIFKKEQLTYQELVKRAVCMAGALRAEGIRHGDRVCFSAVSGPEMVAAYMAVRASGAVAVFLDKNGTPESMAAICTEAGASLLLTDKPVKGKVLCRILSLREMYRRAGEAVRNGSPLEPAVPVSPEEEEIAELLFTTGTTGKPKGVILTCRSVYHILTDTAQGIGIQREDCLLLPLPLHHSFALRVLRAVLYQGGTVVLQNGFTFAREAEQNVSAFGCNCMAAVPAAYEIMRSQMQDAFARVLGGMRFIEFGAGALSIRQRKEITELLSGVRIFNTWGSSESGGAVFCDVTQAVRDPARAGMLGKTLPHVQVKIVDADGKEMDSSSTNPGRMALKGDMLMAGYWKQPQLTEKTLTAGWLLTGDMAYMDEEGYLYMLGRADDIINVGGEKVSPVEVEEAAGQYAFVRECACIGVDDPDGILGQVPVLFVAVKSGYTQEGLLKFLSTRLERHKIPRQTVVVRRIPRNRIQKTDRGKLRMLWEDKESLELMNPVMQVIFSRRSVRKFTEQEIRRPVLEMIVRAGCYAPSGHNMQSWRFTVLTSQEDIRRLREKTQEAAQQNRVYFYGWENPQALVLVSNDKRNADGCQDASCAAENIMLAAASYGIGSVWLNPLKTLRDAPPVKSELDSLGIPQNDIVWAAIALGYPVAEGALLQKKEEVIHFIQSVSEKCFS